MFSLKKYFDIHCMSKLKKTTFLNVTMLIVNYFTKLLLHVHTCIKFPENKRL